MKISELKKASKVLYKRLSRYFESPEKDYSDFDVLEFVSKMPTKEGTNFWQLVDKFADVRNLKDATELGKSSEVMSTFLGVMGSEETKEFMREQVAKLPEILDDLLRDALENMFGKKKKKGESTGQVEEIKPITGKAIEEFKNKVEDLVSKMGGKPMVLVMAFNNHSVGVQHLFPTEIKDSARTFLRELSDEVARNYEGLMKTDCDCEDCTTLQNDFKRL